jgi:hypothetical protein
MEAEDKIIILSARELAMVLAIKNSNYINELVEKYGAPAPFQHGRYDAGKFIPWYIERQRKIEEEKRRKLVETDPEFRYKTAQAEEKEMKNAERRGKLIPDDQVRYCYGALAALFTKRIEALPGILAPVLVGASRENITEIISKEIESIQQQIANETRDKFPEPAPDVSGNTEADA